MHTHKLRAQVGTACAGTCAYIDKDITVSAFCHVSIRPSQEFGHQSPTLIYDVFYKNDEAGHIDFRWNLCGPIKIIEERRTK